VYIQIVISDPATLPEITTTDKIQLYSLATPNGQKIGIALEEMGIPYDAHTINIMTGDQFSEEFIKVNPNSKIPAIVDPVGDHGKPLNIFESGAILMYLAEKSGKFLPSDTTQRSRVLQWLFFQMGGVGPMFGQFGHFTVYAKDERDLTYGAERYTKEALRLLQVIETQLETHTFIAGEEISIADMAIMPWVSCLDKYYKAKDKLNLDSFVRTKSWVETLLARPATARGMEVCSS
jgi:GSH-dependent disulfide-bond oxidoreductase